MKSNPRAAAALSVAAVLQGQSLTRALPRELARLESADRPLARQLCYGTLRAAPRLQGFLNQLLDKPLKTKDSDVHATLLVGLYQLEQTRIPDHAAVSTSVDTVIQLKKRWAKGLVNAILRRFLREKEALVAGLDEAASAGHPAWLFGQLLSEWPQQAERIIEANNAQPPLTLRVNALQTTRAAYLDTLADASISARAGMLSESAIYLDEAMDVTQLPGFDQGLVSVQDEAAQIAATLFAPAAGDRLLDACAAPGGKTCHLLESHPQVADVVALDNDPGRLDRVRQNLSRLRLDAQVLEGSADAAPAELQPASFNHILVDAPCSASGVLRRNPDIKLLRRQSDIPQFARQQRAILDGVWELLRPGGMLVYATCSVFDAENSAVVEQFAAATDSAAVLPVDATWGFEQRAGRQLLPTAGAHDGLFYALLQKRL